MKTQQDAFLKLVLEQLGQNSNQKKFLEQINALFVLIPTKTPQYLKSIETQLKNASLSPAQQKTLDTKLKTAWYQLWREGTYQKNHEKEFLRFYPKLTQPQQQALKNIFEDKKITVPISSQNTKSKNILSAYNQEFRHTKNLAIYLRNIQSLEKITKDQGIMIIKNIDKFLYQNASQNEKETPDLVNTYHFLIDKTEISFPNLFYSLFSYKTKNFLQELFLFSPQNFKPLYDKLLKNTKTYDNKPIDLGNCIQFFEDKLPLVALFHVFNFCQANNSNESESATYLTHKFFNFLDNFELIDPQNLKSLFKNTIKATGATPQKDEHLLLFAWDKLAQKGQNSKVINKTFQKVYIDLPSTEEEFCQKLTEACQIYEDRKKLQYTLSVPQDSKITKQNFKI